MPKKQTRHDCKPYTPLANGGLPPTVITNLGYISKPIRNTLRDINNYIGNETMKTLNIHTAINWLALDTVRVTSIGSENTYYIDQFGNGFFCKNYPDNDLVGWGVVYAPSSTYQ